MKAPASYEMLNSTRVADAIARCCGPIVEETAIAMVFDGTSHAVMMATPDDLQEFAIGFALSEGIVQTADQILDIEVTHHALGIELRCWLDAGRAAPWRQYRRRLAGPTGCGLCGVGSLNEAARETPTVSGHAIFTSSDVHAATAALAPQQQLHSRTKAAHAAAFYRPKESIMMLREDVGRHNALDKLIGALAVRGQSTKEGMLVLTSRLSVELVHKAAQAGMPVIIAISAPTTLALRVADAAGITVIARARSASFEIFSHAHRIRLRPESGVI